MLIAKDLDAEDNFSDAMFSRNFANLLQGYYAYGNSELKQLSKLLELDLSLLLTNTSNESWIDINVFRSLIEVLLLKLSDKKDLHSMMSFNHDWNDYFEYEAASSDDNHNFRRQKLSEDLKELLNGLDDFAERGMKSVTFNFG